MAFFKPQVLRCIKRSLWLILLFLDPKPYFQNITGAIFLALENSLYFFLYLLANIAQKKSTCYLLKKHQLIGGWGSTP